MQVFPTTRQNQ
uniref:Uncharacterized protein n=1 Tax=Anopheles quadriannulatus TaxID=34691 RepID=A0A182XQU1_ANOQN